MAKFSPDRAAEINWWAQVHFQKGTGNRTMQTELLAEAAEDGGCRVPKEWRVNKTLSEMAEGGFVIEHDDVAGMRRYVITVTGRAALALS